MKKDVKKESVVSKGEDDVTIIKEAGLSTIAKYSVNPFISELKGKMYLQPRANTIIAKGQSIVDTVTGEIIDESVLVGRRKIVDKSQFAKIYCSEIALLFNLSKCATNVFLHLVKVLEYNNKAYFSYRKEHKKVGYSSYVTCYNGLLELIRAGIIAADTRENFYWLNPIIVCKGERFAIYKEYVTEDEANSAERNERLLAQSQKEHAQKYDDEVQAKLNALNERTRKQYAKEAELEMQKCIQPKIDFNF